MRASQIVKLIEEAALDKKGEDPVILNLVRRHGFVRYFFIVHGTSDRHARTIADHIEYFLREKGERPFHSEGKDQGKWILLDYGDVWAHVFHHETRRFYNLERLWGSPEAPKRTKKHARKH